MIKLFYCTDKNFGDAMSPLVVGQLSGQSVVPASVWGADMMGVGSVFYHGGYLLGESNVVNPVSCMKHVVHSVHRVFSRELLVWGSGFLQYPTLNRAYAKRRLCVRAVRGTETLAILKRYGLVANDFACAFGDPGLLYAKLRGIVAAPKYDLGIIPHVYDAANWGAALKDAFDGIGVGTRLIDASQEPDVVVRNIAACERVISSSLHGLIVADSLQIPNLHMELSKLEFSDEDFKLKFKDYYSAFGESVPTMVSGKDLIAHAKEFMQGRHFTRRNPDELERVQEGLMESFPFRGGNR